MGNNVGEVSQGGEESNDPKNNEEIEDRRLKESEEDRSDRRSEAFLRRFFRLAAFSIIIILMIMLWVTLDQVKSWLMSGQLTDFSSFHIVAYVVPISSLTILSLALMVSAFRGHHKNVNYSLLSAGRDIARKLVP